MYHKESPKELEVLERSIKKNNSPSPVTYLTEEAREKTQFDKSYNFFRISKSKKETITDVVIKRAKKSPGVGQYKIEEALDKKVYRPMGRPRAH